MIHSHLTARQLHQLGMTAAELDQLGKPCHRTVNPHTPPDHAVGYIAMRLWSTDTLGFEQQAML